MKLNSVRAAIFSAFLAGAMSYAIPCLHAQPSSTTPSSAAQSDSSQANLSGNWKMSFTDPQGTPRTGTMKLQQDGANVTGTYQGARGTFPLTGTIEGNEVKIAVKAMGRQLAFEGTVDGDKMSGTTPRGATWNATREQ